MSDNKAEKIIDLTLCVLDLTATGGIPILSSIKETAKCIKDIPNEIFLIKLDRFIKAVTSNDEKDVLSFRKLYKKKYLNNDEVRLEHIKWLMIKIDSFNEEKKAEWMGILFKWYIEEKLEWKRFCIFVNALEFLLVQDVETLLTSNFEVSEYNTDLDLTQDYKQAKNGKIKKEDNATPLNLIEIDRGIYLRLLSVGLASISGATLSLVQMPDIIKVPLDKDLALMISILSNF
ncbi:hypothetical protein [Veillonella sp.]|uniref:hypothetical protein n=1 Tax=Veillonella sp. TaxID=1926307 RepID=UPI00257AE1C5|nr:hypothetical protein [Veillonella sp.]